MAAFFSDPKNIALIFVVLVAMISMRFLYFFFIARADDIVDPFHQNLTIGAFSIVVTALVVLLGLMPKTQEAVGHATGTIGIITFNIAGPPAIWLIVFLITAREFGSVASMPAEQKGSGLNLAIEGHYRVLGFNYYRNWLAALSAFRSVVERSELHFIDDLLPKVFYHGPFGLIKPQNVISTTLFVYSKQKAVKFQRIRGSVRTEDGMRSQVYLTQTASTQGGQVSCLHLIRSGDSLLQTARHAHGEWKLAPVNTIDFLIIAVYDNDDIGVGDYIYVDITKYIDLEQMDDAKVELAIVCDKRIEEFNVWEVSTSLVSTEKPVPLMFRNLQAQTESRTESEIEKNTDQISNMFDKWGLILDRAMDGKPGQCVGVSSSEVQDFLSEVKGVFAQEESGGLAVSFQELFRKPPATDCVVTKLKQQRNVILTTFSWG
ncbi:MAG: hypothetical protein QOK48_2692 [Blastocatellia bacterium]|jgi:hypothetical protein|nr:hypothetical protein [Blastocatellia bacterium]